jgi:hypothetical protein
MSVCVVCGCSIHERSKDFRSVRDSVSIGSKGVGAEGDRRGASLSKRSLGRALRRQRSRWVELTNRQRLRRIFFFGFAPMLLISVPFMLESPTDNQINTCPSDEAPTAESMPAMFDDTGTVEKLDLTDRSTIAMTIYASQVNHGGQMDLRNQMGQLMRELHQVAVCFPRIKTIRTDLMAPSESRHDEYGNSIDGAEVIVVSLRVTADDLRSFKPNFEWDSYPIFAANRYARSINVNLSDVWHRELEKEEEIGDFVNTL